MKQLIPFLFFIFLTFQMQAQCDLVAEPNPYIATMPVDFSSSNGQAITHGYFINNSAGTVNVKWEVVVDGDCPDNWDYQVCDNNNCYIWGVLTNYGNGPVNVPVKLDPGDTSILELHIRPNAVSGCCKPSIQLSCIDDVGTIVETAEFDICIENSTDVTEKERVNLRVFPNPTSNYISLTNNNFVNKLWVSNILGKRVKTFDTMNGLNYDVRDLPDGIYLVSMVGENNKVLKTVRISKRNIRP